MELILLVVHLVLAVVLIGVVLMQRSEGGGLGIGGGGGGGGGAGMSGLMTGRGTANFLTRTTAILAACFMATSIGLAILAGGHGESGSILDQPVEELLPPPIEDSAPAEPSVPVQ